MGSDDNSEVAGLLVTAPPRFEADERLRNFPLVNVLAGPSSLIDHCIALTSDSIRTCTGHIALAQNKFWFRSL